jgi:potassium-transporting ATPase ATP-binding subunit
MFRKKSKFVTTEQVLQSIKSSFAMLTPAVQWKNPVMFVAYLGAILTTIHIIHEWAHAEWVPFHIQICLWLWFTVLFANFAEAIAESRGKAQAASLRKTQVDVFARKIVNGKEKIVPAQDLRKGDVVICEVGEIIPADGDVMEGIATVDESAVTGESAPVIREHGGDRSAVTAGTRIVSDKLIITVTSEKGKSFLDHMILMIEGAKRQKTPNEISLHILLCGLTIVFLVTVFSLKLYADYTTTYGLGGNSNIINLPVLAALLICLIPTTISALLNAVGIAGMDRLIRCNVIAKSGRSVEAAGDIDMLILDKTGTITLGNRMATALLPSPGIPEKDFAEIAQLASLSDETPEGRSIVILSKNLYGLRAESLNVMNSVVIPFSATTRMSGIDYLDTDGKVIRRIRKGAADAIQKHIENLGGVYSPHADSLVSMIAHSGGTPLLVSDDQKIVGVIHLKDVVKGGIKERFGEMRKMGIQTLMITGDNPLTAAAIAAEAGVDDFVAEATPEMKLDIIREEQKKGKLVAMTGDGTNDAPALAQADVAVAMNTGTQASREAGNMVDLDSNPTKLLDIVEIGKQLLMTRGALTTFSLTNDIAKYFAIIPAIFGTFYNLDSGEGGPLNLFNIMMLHSHQSAILSAVIFNALVIIGLIPLALKGVSCKAQSAYSLLQKNVLMFGLGGIIVPFFGIKLIDMVITLLGFV